MAAGGSRSSRAQAASSRAWTTQAARGQAWTWVVELLHFARLRQGQLSGNCSGCTQNGPTSSELLGSATFAAVLPVRKSYALRRELRVR